MPARLLHNGQEIRVQGYAALFNTWTQSESGVLELFRPDCFASFLERGAPGAVANWNHDNRHIFARTADWTLKLWGDSTGLSFEATVDVTPFGLGLVRYVSEGTAASSVYFMKNTCSETEAGIEIAAASVLDVCVTWKPAGPTACWLDSAQPESLTPYARELRECWLAGRDARRAAQIARLHQDYAASQAQAKPAARQPRPVDDIDWCEPPPGIDRETWLWFGTVEQHVRRLMRQ